MDVLFRSFYIMYGFPLAITLGMLLMIEKWYLRIYDADPTTKFKPMVINVKATQKNLTSTKLGTYLAVVGLVGGLIFGLTIAIMANALDGNFWVVSLVYALMLIGIAIMGDHLAQQAYQAQQRDWQDKLIRYQKGHSAKEYQGFNSSNLWNKSLDKIVGYILVTATTDEYTKLIDGKTTKYTAEYYKKLHTTTDRKEKMRMINRYQDLMYSLKKTISDMPTHRIKATNIKRYHQDKVERWVAVVTLVVVYIILGLDSFGGINIMGTLFPKGAPMGILLLVTLVKLILILGIFDITIDKTKNMLLAYVTGK